MNVTEWTPSVSVSMEPLPITRSRHKREEDLCLALDKDQGASLYLERLGQS